MAKSEDLNLNINVKGASEARRDIDRVADEAEDLDRKKVEVEISADDKASGVMDDLAKKAGDLPGIFGKIGSAIGGTGGLGAGAAGIAAGLGAAALHASDLALEADQVANFTGASVEEASALQAVLRDTSNVEMNDLLDVVAQMSGVLAASPELAAQLGINLADAKNPLDQMVMVIDALNASQLGSQEKLVLGAKLFGEEGVRQVNEITAALEGPLAGAIAEVGEGRIITEEDVADARQFKEQWAEFQASLETIATQLGQTILPLLAKGVTLVNTLLGTPLDPNNVWGADEWTAAFDQWISEADGVTEKLNEFEAQGGVLDNLISGTLTATDRLAALKAGIPVEAFQQMQGAVAGVPPELVEIARTGGFASRGLDLVATSLTAVDSAGAPVPRTLEEINAALAGQEHLTATAAQNWRIITQDMADGAINTQAAADAVNIMQEYLGLENAEMDALIAQKTDEYMLDVAAAEEEAAAEALRLQQAVADLGDTMASIDADDLANISGGLETELNKVDDLFAGLKFDVDFQPALNEALDGLESFGPDLQTLADEWAGILTGKPIDIFGNVRADDAEFQAKMGALTDLFQEGVVNAFDQGGVEAANTFVQSTAAQIAASTGLDIAEVYRIMGLPPDGSVDMLLKPIVDAEAKADALAILDGLIGVDPNNPILAYMRLGVQTDQIPAQVAEAAAKILAGQALNVPAKLEEFSQADIDAAYALLAEQEVTVPTAADITGAQDDIGDVEDGDYQATIDALADTQVAARQLLDETTRQRQATIYAIAAITSAKAALDSLRERRTASILAVAYTAGAEYELNHTARRRDSYIYTHTVNVGGGTTGGSTGGITGGTLMAPAMAGPALMTAPMTTDGEIGTPSPMSVPSSGVAVVSTAPASVVNNMQVTVQAAVIGNRHEVERTVAKALRSYTRLNGSRN